MEGILLRQQTAREASRIDHLPRSSSQSNDGHAVVAPTNVAQEVWRRLASALEAAIPLLQQQQGSSSSSAIDTSIATAATTTIATTVEQSADGGFVSPEWLLQICATVAVDLQLPAPYLAKAVIQAAHNSDPAQQQEALFQLFGNEAAWDILMQIASRLDEIRSQQSTMTLQAIDEIAVTFSNSTDVPLGTSTTTGASSTIAIIGEEETNRQRLFQEAVEAAQIAALAQAETDHLKGIRSGGHASAMLPQQHTHTVGRASDKKAIKAAEKTAEKAAKRAALAWQRAKDYGAVVDDDTFQQLVAQGLQSNTDGDGGMLHFNSDQYAALQQSLLPEGSRQYYDDRGLPVGSERWTEGDVEIVRIPPTAPLPSVRSGLNQRLRIADILHGDCRIAFAGVSTLNPMQSIVFPAAYQKRDNLLICAPTGAGKTNVALLCVVAHLRDVGLLSDREPSKQQHANGRSRNNNHSDHDHNNALYEEDLEDEIDVDNDGDVDDVNAIQVKRAVLDTGHKIVYIAPMKALAQEVVEKFRQKLQPLQLIVRELTGDMQLTRAEAASAHILVTTPEKWDVVTRKAGTDANSLGNQCGLLLLDEVHLLADERGAVIESVVARTHRLVESRQQQVRIVALSATLPNYRDVATFLHVPESGLFFFGPEYRPVPLQQTFMGVSMPKGFNTTTKDDRINQVCFDQVLDSVKRGYQVMVFVHSRKGTGSTATALSEIAHRDGVLEQYFVAAGKDGPEGIAYNRYTDRVQKSRNREVAMHFEYGMGIHHAGMLRGDRKLTEQMFIDGAIKVLCCTATLAWGVNLPAHSVIIKGTDVYNPEKGRTVDLSILDVQQIFGRAGRPQFDTSGEATLITSHQAFQRYMDKLVRAVPIESNFIKQLADHLNAEIVGGTVTNVKEALAWLRYTYLFVRMQKNPLAYGINHDEAQDDPLLRKRCLELITNALQLLNDNKMIRYDPQVSENFGVANNGTVAAHYYIQAESIGTFNEMLLRFPSPTDADLCRLICSANEFSQMKVREEELEELDGLAVKTCPLFHPEQLREKKNIVASSVDKAFVLLQAYIGRAKIKGFTLISDTNYIASNAGRVARGLFEILKGSGDSGPMMRLIRIAKSIEHQIWWFQSPLRHFETEIQAPIFVHLERTTSTKAYDTLESALALLDMTAHEVAQLCRCNEGQARMIQRLIRTLPTVHLECHVQPITTGVLRFQIQITAGFEWHGRWHGNAQYFWLFIEDGKSNRIYHHGTFSFPHRTYKEPVNLEVAVPVFSSIPDQYLVRVVSDLWVGVEHIFPVSLFDIKMPVGVTKTTQLLDLTPLPISALKNPQYEQLYTKYAAFNPIQTQLFHVLYHTDVPVLLGAPTGSGKTTVAEIALARMKQQHPRGICVYIAPLKALARERLKEWERKLGSYPLKWNILELTGDTRHDQGVLERADVLVCTPEKWDLISRSWRASSDPEANGAVVNGKDFVQRVRLLVLDEVHLLGEERGAVLEAIVSRTRFISRYVAAKDSRGDTKEKCSNQERTRIIGLSTALANAGDLADWIGIDMNGRGPTAMRGLYNFSPSVRPVPATVHVQGFQGKHYCPRMATMNKPCYAAINDLSPTKPVLIFVASRRQTRLTAFDLISYAAADDNPNRFLGCDDAEAEATADRISDESLRHTITFGIGLHHAGLASSDREIVEKMFLERKCQVLVATATLAWGVNLPAHMVIVKGTEYFDGKSSQYVEYPLTDVLQMIGRAGRPGFDTHAQAVVMVQADKKIFYKKFLYTPFPVESCLHERLCETLNAEISGTGRTVESLDDAIGYMSWTFFSRRVKANPTYYGAESDSDEHVEAFLVGTVKSTLLKLHHAGCIEYNEHGDFDSPIIPKVLGKAAANFYLNHQTPEQMLKGMSEVRKVLVSMINNSESGGNLAILSDRRESVKLAMRPLQQSLYVDELSIAWLLYVLSSTHEFDELPVRHNEELLNEELSDGLMWGPDTTALIAGADNDRYINPEIYEDPHTKAFLLIQAYLERARLPISDYVNDTKSVIDNVPRLLAAMRFIALEDKTTPGSFEVLSQFAHTKQILEARCVVADDPLMQLPGVTADWIRRLRNQVGKDPTKEGADSLLGLRSLPRSEAASLLQAVVNGSPRSQQAPGNQALDTLYGFPQVDVLEISARREIDTATASVVGKMKVLLQLERRVSSRILEHSKSNTEKQFSLNLILGTSRQSILLASAVSRVTTQSPVSTAKSAAGSMAQSYTWTLEKELTFDYATAKAHGGEGGGYVILRLLWDEFRGMDREVQVALHVHASASSEREARS